ncbi:hypothetical protein TNCV_3506831 [Trichonephila clavipes]|uniref:Uncharacterized protein n=1 Tax=Trichonephila clavipes TaxID=2585209 RepID=A0A8X6S103_TRICX|nr:hypothetical protein TNCV_3506831 [Trichonephila clavipes]
MVVLGISNTPTDDTFQRLKNASPQNSSLLRATVREFERGRIIGLKQVGWAKRRIARHMGRRDAANR